MPRSILNIIRYLTIFLSDYQKKRKIHKSWKKNINRLKTNFESHCFIDSYEAKKLGYSTIYFSWRGIGDQILLLGAAEEYYRLTGNKLLLAVDRPEFFANSKACYILSDYHIDNFWNNLSQTTLDKVYLPGGVFNLVFLNSATYKHNRLIFPRVPMQGTLLSNLGCSGLVNCSPKITLTEKEKQSGALFPNQICVMTGGNVPYKVLPTSTMQEVVNVLKDKYHIIQLGAKGDQPLSGTHYLCGIPLRRAASILANSNVFVGTIGGLMHMAEAVNCPSVIAWSGEPEIYGGYHDQLHIFSPQRCNRCANNELNPLFDKCSLSYQCIKKIKSKDLIEAIKKKAKSPEIYNTVHRIEANKAIGIEDVKLYLKLPPAIRV